MWALYMEELVLLGRIRRGKFILYTQQVNSPDLNILDLGFFWALQALYYQEAPKDAGEMIAMVEHT